MRRVFVAHADRVFLAIERIILRPHPAEPAEKYDWLPARSRWPGSIQNSASLLEHLLAADAVAGYQNDRDGRRPAVGPARRLLHSAREAGVCPASQEILMMRDVVPMAGGPA